MKFVTLTALVASVSAQTGVTCTDPGSGWTASTAAPYDTPTTHAECKAAADAATLDDTKDHCLASVDQTDDTANGGAAASYVCTMYESDATGADDIRAAATDTTTLTHEAWAWVASVASADWVDSSATAEEEVTTEEEGDEEDDEEALSVKMTASAIAAATVAMMAF